MTEMINGGKQMAKKRLSALFLIIVVLMAAALPVGAGASGLSIPEKPANEYVLDEAQVLTDTVESEIVRINTDLFAKTGAQIAVVTTEFISGRDIEEYAYQIFTEWGIGSKERNNGVLFVMATAEEDYWLMPGYGIEDFLTGAYLKDMLNTYVEPDFAVRNYSAAAEKLVTAMNVNLSNYYLDYKDEYSNQNTYTQGNSQSDYSSGGSFAIGGGVGVIIVCILLIVFVSIFSSFRRRSYRGYGGYGGGNNLFTGILLGSMLGRNARRGGFYGRRPPGGFGGFGGSGRNGGGGFGGFGGGGGFGGFSGGGGSFGGGAGR